MNHRISKANQFALAFLLVLFAWSACLAQAPGKPKKVVTIEGITEYRLDNGLRVLLFPDESAGNVTVNLTVLVGSRHEGYGETGMAHLLEHMVFKGTPKHPDVPKALRDHGAQFNGTTWVDRTNYFETMPASEENLEFGIHLEADRLVNSYVKREDLASEMTVVRNEFEAGENNEVNILSQRMTAVAYEWHNYGKSTIGNRSDIERVPIENLQAFYRKHYQPDNCVLVVAGKFKEDKALELIGKYFAAIPRPKRRLDTTYTEEPPQDGERTVILRRVGKIGVVGALYHIPAGLHEDFPALEVLNHVLINQPSGRLYKALVESKKAATVSGFAMGTHDPSVIEFTVTLDPSNPIEEARKTLIDQLEGLPKATFSKEEIDRAKTKLLTDWELQFSKSNQVGIRLSEWAAMGDWRLIFLHRDRLKKVITEDVARVAEKYFQRTNRTVGMFIPAEKPEFAAIPEAPKVDQLVKDYKGGQGIATGEAFEPTPENIEKRVQRSELASGVKVALLPKKTRGETVLLHLDLHFGNEDSLKGHETAGQLLGEMMLRGTKNHTRQQLKDELNKLGARLNVNTGAGGLTCTIDAKRKNLEAVLKLLGEILREPTFPAEELDVLKRERKTALERNLTEPTALAINEIQRRINPYPEDDVRYVPTIPESITRVQAVTVEEIRKLYIEQLGGQNGELAIVGDFDADSSTKAVGEILADWKSPVPYKRIARPAKTDVPGDRHVIVTPGKANAIFVAAEMLAMRDDDPEFPALRIADFLFGEAPLSSRISNRVRGKEGLSYGAGTQFVADSKDKSAAFFIFAICNPINIDKVDQAIAEELDKMVKGGATEKEVAEAKDAYLKGQKTRRATDSYVAAVLADGLSNDRTFVFYADLEKKVADLKVEDVNSAFRKYISAKRLIMIRAGDFSKKSQ